MFEIRECIVLNKRSNYELWSKGFLGNKLRMWRTYDEWAASGFNGLLVLRYLAGGGGGRCTYHLKPHELAAEMDRWERNGADRKLMMINEMAPGQETTIQGELFNGIQPDDASGEFDTFLHSFVNKPMREALAEESFTTHGLRSRLLLKHFMTPSSYEDLLVLLEIYPNHVFEISVFSKCLGDTPGRNAVVWEVRRY